MIDPIIISGTEVRLPWAILLLIPPLLALFLRAPPRSSLPKALSRGDTDDGRIRIWVLRAAIFSALLSMVAASLDITRAYVLERKVHLKNRVIAAVDVSGSMFIRGTYRGNVSGWGGFEYGSGTAPVVKCSDEILEFTFPRIFGACRLLRRTIDRIEAHGKATGDESKHEFGLMRFADNTAIDHYPTSDLSRARRTLESIDWMKTNGIGAGTSLHYAVWALMSVALERNRSGRDGATILTDEEILTLERSLAPDQGADGYLPPDEIRPKLDKIKEELRDTALVVVTDADGIESTINIYPYSIAKMLRLARYLEVPYHFISIAADAPTLKGYALETGTIAAPGGFMVVPNEDSLAGMEVMLDGMLATRLARAEMRGVEVRKSFAPLFAQLALGCILLAIFMRETSFARSFTQD